MIFEIWSPTRISFRTPSIYNIYISNLHKAVEFSSVHHFPFDTNLILTDKSMKKINKHVMETSNWLLCGSEHIRFLNTSKTGFVIFKTKNILIKHLNFSKVVKKLSLQSSQVKYLGLVRF